MPQEQFKIDWELSSQHVNEIREGQRGYYWVKATSDLSGSNVLEVLEWHNIRMYTYYRFLWYFRYRQALLQVKYPKANITAHWGVEDIFSQEEKDKIHLKYQIIAKKRKITEWKNKIQAYKDNWVSLFPIEEDPQYTAAMNKLHQKEEELHALII
jgi:hypothetical protein